MASEPHRAALVDPDDAAVDGPAGAHGPGVTGPGDDGSTPGDGAVHAAPVHRSPAVAEQGAGPGSPVHRSPAVAEQGGGPGSPVHPSSAVAEQGAGPGSPVDASSAAPPARRRAAGSRRSGSASRGRRLFQHDRSLGVRWIVGADEAGRGCLAGPLVAGAVLFDLERIGPREVRALGALDDSKAHTAEERERLFGVVLRIAERVGSVSRCVEGLDGRGLHVTNLEALSTAARRVARPGALCLTDGFRVPDTGFDQRHVVGGDAKSAAIAAASIVAKVTRDRFMHRAAARLPAWGFDQHMGYGTTAHQDAIRQHGLSELHRRSFRAVAYEGWI